MRRVYEIGECFPNVREKLSVVEVYWKSSVGFEIFHISNDMKKGNKDILTLPYVSLTRMKKGLVFADSPLRLGKKRYEHFDVFCLLYFRTNNINCLRNIVPGSE